MAGINQALISMIETETMKVTLDQKENNLQQAVLLAKITK